MAGDSRLVQFLQRVTQDQLIAQRPLVDEGIVLASEVVKGSLELAMLVQVRGRVDGGRTPMRRGQRDQLSGSTRGPLIPARAD
jgi:hypothetical protein